MYFVDGHGSMEPITFPAHSHPLRIAPCMRTAVFNQRGVGWAMLELASPGIAFDGDGAVAQAQLKLVERAFWQSWNEQLPDAAVAAAAQRVATPIPAVEVTHHTDTHGIGCPYRE